MSKLGSALRSDAGIITITAAMFATMVNSVFNTDRGVKNKRNISSNTKEIEEIKSKKNDFVKEVNSILKEANLPEVKMEKRSSKESSKKEPKKVEVSK
jgi:hypothetical protein